MPTVDYRARILDAAEECLLEHRMSARLHAQIAERAGVSRPTVYKYVGDQDDIFRALMERQALRYVEAVMPELARPMPLPDHFAYLTAFSVQWFREAPLMQAVLENDADRYLLWITGSFQSVVGDAARGLAPVVREAMPSTRTLPVPLEEILEWGIRTTVGVIFMPSAHRPLDDRQQIEDYVRGFLAAMVTGANG